MDLILWRHAEAEDIHGHMNDADRPLTAKGRRQAQKMAAWLNARLPPDTRIIVTPAVRTVQPAEALDRKFEQRNELFTSAAVSDHLGIARWPVDGTVLLVGHQPTLGQLAALLMSGHSQHWDLKKGAVMWLRSAPDGSEAHATLRAAMVPSMLE